MSAERSPKPTVRYHKELQRAPYSISIDSGQISDLLIHAGHLMNERRPVPAADISRLKIVVKRQHPSDVASFEYWKGRKREKRRVTVYGNDTWMNTLKHCKQSIEFQLAKMHQQANLIIY